ncbi:MAG: tetratricopeptide repeat protein [Pseudomonadota bacterium]
MTKFIRCIEGHVYDTDKHEACPECGAIPGVEESGRIPISPVEEREPKSNFKDTAHALLSKSAAKDSAKVSLFALPKAWLAGGGALLLLVVAAVYGLTQEDTPETLARSEIVGSEPTKDDAPDEDVAKDPAKKGEEEADGTTSSESDNAQSQETDDDPRIDETEPAADAEQARADADESVDEAERDDAKAEEEKKLADLRQRVTEHVKKKDYDSAIADLTEIIRHEAATWDDVGSRAWMYYTKRDFDLALADFDRALKSEDHSGLIHYGRALILRQRGDIDGALVELNAVIDDHGSQDPFHYIERADVYALRAKYDEAIADNDTAVELVSNVKSATPWSKAQVYFHRGINRLKQVKADPENLKDNKPCKDPTSDTARENADCRAEVSLFIPLLDFEAAVAIYPEYAQAHAEIASIAFQLGNSQRAVDASTKAIKIDPTNSAAYTNRCMAYNSLKQYDLAMADCNDAIRHTPASARAWTLRGYVYATRGGRNNRNKAISDLRHALEITPGYADALTVLELLGEKP